MNQLINTLREYIDPDRMLETAGRVSEHHRIQASPGYRAAAQYCRDRLENHGIQTVIHSYPADGVHPCSTDRALREWAIEAGECTIEGFGQIADYSQIPLSVICRSAGCDFRQTPLEVVYLDKSADRADYAGIDLAGKLAFVRGNIKDFAWVCQDCGGAGLITDYVLHPETQQDVLRYTSFWWKEDPGETRYSGFCMSPRQGKALAEHCLRAREDGVPVLARGFIDARFYDGAMEVVDAFLPGQTGQEILAVAHLCHPMTSSNDNASGVAAVIEGLSALRRAVADGKLPPLRRGVRVLLVPEMAGTSAWLRSLPEGATGDVLAAINLDMVGGRQDPGYGPLVLTSLPRSTPSFTEYAAMAALEAAASEYSGFNPAVRLPSVNHAIETFAGGSDHYILSDPTVGIPCTMLGQWPDRFYHTSGDTMDRLSPDTLRASCATMAGFCARMAGLAPGDLPALLARGKVRFAQELGALEPDSGEAASHYLATYQAAFGDALRFFPQDAETAALVEAGQAALAAIHSGFCAQKTEPAAPRGDSRVPRRLWAQPLANIDLAAQLAGREEALTAYEQGPQKQLREAYQAEFTACYYMDGRRTVGEIIALVEADLGPGLPQLKDYIELLEALALVEFE